MKAIYYKNWLGEWVKYNGKATLKNLAIVKNTKALNGQASIQTI